VRPSNPSFSLSPSHKEKKLGGVEQSPECSSSPGALSQSLSPHVQGELRQGQRLTQCHQAFSQCHTINPAFSQPGPEPRVKCTNQNKIKQCLGPYILMGGAHASPVRADLSPCVPRVTSLGRDHMSPLATRVEQWRACAVHPWILSMVSQGYRLQFAMKPPRFNNVLVSMASGDSARILEDEISSLLRKQAIRAVPNEQAQQGFYSRYFLIPKRGSSSLRPILDLRVLNRHLRKYTFRMLTHKVLCRSIRPGDWFVTIDLSDAYFHIAIYPAHRKFLRFAFQNRAYEYRVVPFGRECSAGVWRQHCHP
jgi:hypothetical protein